MANESAVKLANTFVSRFSETSSLEHMKLQKLCYYAYGWWLALMPNDPPLTASKPQVWKLGPVFHPIYSAYAAHKGSQLSPQDIKRDNPFSNQAEVLEQGNTPESQMVDWIWGKYGAFSGFQLSDKTHEVGTPWFNIAQKHQFSIPRYTDIPDDENRTYFSNLARAEGVIQ